MMEAQKIGALESSNRSWSRIREWIDGDASRSALILLILLHLGITITLSLLLNIWIDEAFTFHTTGKDLAYAFNQALRFELQPPLYFILLNLWRKLNDSIFFARLFSALCAGLTLYTIIHLSRRYLREVSPAWIVAALAFNPFLIWAAVEMRVYALVLLLSALLLLLFFDGFLEDEPRFISRLLYVLVSILALYTQYYLGFLLVGNFVALLVLRRWRSLLAYLLSMCVVAICFAPMLSVAHSQTLTFTSPAVESSPFRQSLIRIIWLVREYLLPGGTESLEFFRRWILRLFFLSIPLLLIKYRHRVRFPQVAIWTILSVSALAFLMILYLAGESALQDRHTALLFLPTMLSAFAIITLVARRRGLVIALVIALLFNAASLSVMYRPLAKNGDWNRVASYIMASEKQGQAILVFHGGNALPLSYCYKGTNVIVPLPRGDSFETYDVRNYVLKDESEIAAALSIVPGDHQQLWLVTYDQCQSFGVDYNCGILEGYVERHYNVASDKTFYQSRVRLLQRK
jgi:Dolichyl-phosphate-mannose-protein mannosyltransferase